MENNKKLIGFILAIVLVVLFLLSLYLYTKNNQKINPVQTVVTNQEENKINTPVLSLVDFSKEDTKTEAIKSMDIFTPKIDEMFKAWSARCLVFEEDPNDASYHKKFIKNNCENEITFSEDTNTGLQINISIKLNKEIKPGQSITYVSDDLESDIFTSSLFTYDANLQINGKVINLPTYANTYANYVEIENENSILVTDYCDGVDGCLPEQDYFDGSKWFSNEKIAQKCIPETYNKLYFFKKPFYDYELKKGYLSISEITTYGGDSFYFDVFNTIRSYYLFGAFEYRCKTPDLNFMTSGYSGYSHYNNPNEPNLNPEYAKNFLSFLQWVYSSDKNKLLEGYIAWPNTITINKQIVRYPADWKIEQTKTNGDPLVDPSKFFRLSKGDKSTVLDDQFFSTFGFYNIDGEEKYTKLIDIEILKVLYQMRLGLIDTSGIDGE